MKQIFISVAAGLVLFFITLLVSGYNQKIDSKASKEYVDKVIIEQEKNVQLIYKDIHHIRERTDLYKIDFDRRFDRIEKKIDCLIKELKN